MGSLQILNGFRGRCALAALCATVAFFLAACGGSSGGGGDTATPASLTLYDPLSGTTLDGQKWSSPLVSFGVASNAMVMSSQISNAESQTVDGLVYSTLANVVTGQRVTTLTADITVPAASKSRTGSAEIRAVLRLQYQPPVNRLFLPGASNLDNLALEVGFNDTGSGLQAMRNIRHCDVANCTIRSAAGINIADPLGFTVSGNSAVAPAVYDTKYTVTVSLNEATGVLSWTIAGGTFGLGVSGTADPANYLAANPHWAGVPLAGAGFFNAQAGTRIIDNAPAGGSSGSISAKFENVQVGFDNAAASTFDDFSGTGTNSGPTELNVAKWVLSGGSSGQGSIAMSAGSLAGHAQTTNSATAAAQNFGAIRFNNPTTFNALQADFTVSTCNNSGAVGKSERVFLSGTFYNDDTAGNQPGSALGDVQALLIWDCLTNASFFVIQRGSSATGFTNISSANNAVPGLAAATNTHTLKMSWDPASHAFSFQVDAGAPVVVDPTTVNPRMTTAAPFVKLANSPQKLLVGGVSVPAGASATASIDVKVNNVFTGP